MEVMKEAVALLGAEQADLEAVLRDRSEEDWLIPTPAHGWDVRDQVSHLADTEEIAYDTSTGGPRQLNAEALSFPSPEAFTESGCDNLNSSRRWWWSEDCRWSEYRRRRKPEKKPERIRKEWGCDANGGDSSS